MVDAELGLALAAGLLAAAGAGSATSVASTFAAATSPTKT